MTIAPPQLLPRWQRIEKVAAIAFGRDPDDPARAAPGWQRRLSAAMGLSHNAVHSTLKSKSSSVFDRKLRTFVVGLREQMRRDIEDLKTIEQILGANEGGTFEYHDAWASTKGDDE